MDSKLEKYLEKNFAPVVAESYSFSEVCVKLGIPTYCGNRTTIKKYIKKYDLDISHFMYGGGSNRDQTSGARNFTNGEVFCVDSPIIWNSVLKNRIFKGDLIEYKCVCCGNEGEWMGKKMTLILDHENGVSNDNRLENLRFVCPNCNATLKTDGIKNMDKSRKRKSGKKLCKCGKTLNYGYKEVLCVKCRKDEKRPSPEELRELSKTHTQSEVGYKYGVTRGVVKRWLTEDNK